MPEERIKIPSFDELMWPTLHALKAMGGSASNEEILAKIIELERIPENVQSAIHSDNRSTRLAYNLAWAKTYLKKAGALENSGRGVWSLTEAGERMTEQDLLSVPAAVRKQVSELKPLKSIGNDADPRTAEEPPPEEGWKDILINVLRQMQPDAFERLSQRLLREAGFVKVEVTGRTGDGGIDGVGVLRVNLLSFQVIFQCKRYQGTVGSGVVRDFRGAMVGRSDKGLIISTGTFSNDAKREATRDGAPAIDLIDGDLLCDLIKKLKLGIQVKMVEQVVVDAEWFEKI